MYSKYKVVDESGKFKIISKSNRIPFFQLLAVFFSLSFHLRAPWVLLTSIFVFLILFSWIFFAVLWYVFSLIFPSYPCAHDLSSFSDALIFSMELQTSFGSSFMHLEAHCFSFLVLFSLQSLFGFLFPLFSISFFIIKLISFNHQPTKKNFISFSQHAIFSKIIKNHEKDEIKANFSEKRRSSVTGRRRSSLSRRNSLFKDKLKAICEKEEEGVQKFNRNPARLAIKNSAFLGKFRSKIVRNVKEKEKDKHGVYKLEWEVKVVRSYDLMLLGLYGFLLIKKKIKTPLSFKLEVLATKTLKLLQPETEDSFREQIAFGDHFIINHIINDKSPVRKYLEFIFKKKKWSEKNFEKKTEHENNSRFLEENPKVPKSETSGDQVKLWDGQFVQEGKLELEVVIIMQCVEISNNDLIEQRASFDLSDLQLPHDPYNFNFN